MAGRSYLNRIAVPLAPGEPVLTARPRPALDDTPPVIILSATAAQPPLRRTASGAPDRMTAAFASPLPPVSRSSATVDPSATPMGEAVRTLTPVSTTPPSVPRGIAAPIATAGDNLPPPPSEPRPGRVAAPRPMLADPDADPPAEPPRVANRRVADFRLTERPAADRGFPAAGPAGAWAKAPRPAAAPVVQPAAAAPAARADIDGSENREHAAPAVVPDVPDLALAPADDREPPYRAPIGTAPRIHIGTVEVRSVAQPVAPPSPAPPSPALPAAPMALPPNGPLARPFAFRYGLVQS